MQGDEEAATCLNVGGEQKAKELWWAGWPVRLGVCTPEAKGLPGVTAYNHLTLKEVQNKVGKWRSPIMHKKGNWDYQSRWGCPCSNTGPSLRWALHWNSVLVLPFPLLRQQSPFLQCYQRNKHGLWSQGSLVCGAFTCGSYLDRMQKEDVIIFTRCLSHVEFRNMPTCLQLQRKKNPPDTRGPHTS